MWKKTQDEFFACPLRQSLRERATLFDYTYTACLVYFILEPSGIKFTALLD
jgi:hypothetical protein